MREIKFRRYHKGKGQLPYPKEFEYFTMHDDPIWQQYTGLHDKNGKEIYEGDVVNAKDYEVLPYKVIFEDGAYCLDRPHNGIELSLTSVELYNIEVIGNIYENPELLTPETI